MQSNGILQTRRQMVFMDFIQTGQQTGRGKLLIFALRPSPRVGQPQKRRRLEETRLLHQRMQRFQKDKQRRPA